MVEISDIFDDAITGKGKLIRFDKEYNFPSHLLGLIESRLSTFQYILQEFIKKIEDPNKMFNEIDKIHVGIIENDMINAYAFQSRSGDKDFIGMNAGTILKLYYYFTTLLAARNAFPEVGNASLELYDITDIKHYLHDSYYRYMEDAPVAICKDRREFAHHLWIISTDFIFSHELSHHLLGHLRYNRANYSLSSLDEYSKPNVTKDINYYAFSQAMEIDADDFGVFFTFHRFDMIYDEMGYHKYGLSVSELILIATSFVFHIFDELSINKSLDHLNTHPHPTLRMMYVLGNLSVYAEEQSRRPEDKQADRISHCLKMLDELKHNTTKFEYTQSYKSPKVHEEYLRLTKILNFLKDNVLIFYSPIISPSMNSL
jgi:hypothetical protein